MDALAISFAIVTVLVLIWGYFKHVYKHWERLGVPSEEYEIPFGSFGNPFFRKEHISWTVIRIYRKHKNLGHKHFGFFVLDKPVYTPIDLEVIKRMLTKDFDCFHDRGLYFNENTDPVDAHLVNLTGNKWKHMRLKLNPWFSASKMKMVFNTVVACGMEMVKFIEQKRLENAPVDGKDISSRYLADAIGSCAFGVECNSFNDNLHDKRFDRRIFSVSMARRVFTYVFPNLSKLLGVKVLSDNLSNFVINVVKDAIDYRNKNDFYRKDILQLLIDMRKEKNCNNDTALTIEQIAAQVYIFFAAGYETTSSTIVFCLYELSLQRKIQNKVREEIRSILKTYDGKLSYEAIQDMKYLSQVLDETLRKYPGVPQLNREVTKNYNIPGTDITLKKGQTVWIPNVALHYDEEYFPNPEQFDPERFSQENRQNIKPYSYMPFGEGPRYCIGQRFGILLSKIGLAVVLKEYDFSLNKKTKLPVKLHFANPFTAARGRILFDVSKAE